MSEGDWRNNNTRVYYCKMCADTESKNFDDDQMKLLCEKDSSAFEKLSLGYNKISHAGMLFFSKKAWDNLYELRLYKNSIGPKGCKYLSSTSMPVLITADLGDNQIQSMGILHLSKAKWDKLQVAHLHCNNLGEFSIKYFVRSNWKSLKRISLDNNYLNFQEIGNLCLTEMKFLDHYQLYLNKFDDIQKELLRQLLSRKLQEGCQYHYE